MSLIYCCCGPPPNPCGGAGPVSVGSPDWTGPMHLTTGGVTMSSPYSSAGVNWGFSGIFAITSRAFIGGNPAAGQSAQCFESIATLPIDIEVTVLPDGCITITYIYGFTRCYTDGAGVGQASPPGGPCGYSNASVGFPSRPTLTGALNFQCKGIVSSFTNSPGFFTGSWGTAIFNSSGGASASPAGCPATPPLLGSFTFSV